ncbi:MAG: winged helix-turn-helix transcriptional regulator, partial [Ruminococcaceae bacterium]|nr:winged helix-turn-helix transcriptional regulator [Oscillospiraceae bacterium]
MKNKILSLLEQDSRLTPSKIAIMLGIEEGDVRAAIKELEDESIILGYKTLINWELAGRETTIANIELK